MTPNESRQKDARLHTLLTGERTGWRFIIPTEQDEMDVYVIGEFDPIIGDKRGLVPDYHTWAGAGLVIDRMRELGWQLNMREWCHEILAGFRKGIGMNCQAACSGGDTFPAAVASAAEAALGAENGES